MIYLRVLIFCVYLIFGGFIAISIDYLINDMEKYYSKVESILLTISLIHLIALSMNFLTTFLVNGQGYRVVYPVAPRYIFAMFDVGLLTVTLWQFSVISESSDASLIVLLVVLTVTMLLCFYKFFSLVLGENELNFSSGVFTKKEQVVSYLEENGFKT